ncbi:MAG: hypothetical protein J0L80_01200 [Chitinophagales bacterium]|nr:hypothetical protein [Chitinophagales bacterium]
MTLCTAFIRRANDTEELVFATDSCLSGGERWHSGVKLFELPRKDCLICFAGETTRTYPLILNLISSIRFDENLSNPNTDISDVLEYLTNLFTTLCNGISGYAPQSFEDALGDFEFMFGGWSWKKSAFQVWKLKYNHELKAFLPNQVNEENMFFAFIGDEIEIAEQLLQEEIAKGGRILARSFDMEPFKVLLQMIRKAEYDSIEGAIQLAKIHPPGVNEFYGVYWPSINGRKTFLGKDVNFENNPAVRFIDPDTCAVTGDELPERIEEPTEEEYGFNAEFVKRCYSEDGFTLKSTITKQEKQTLRRIFKEIAYKQFLEKPINIEQPENAEEV